LFGIAIICGFVTFIQKGANGSNQFTMIIV